MALDGAHLEVHKLLRAPSSNLTMDRRIYIGLYHQAELEVAVDFHLGSKVPSVAIPHILDIILALMVLV